MNQNKLNKYQLMSKKQISIIGMVSKDYIDELKRLRQERLNHLEDLGLIVRNGGESLYLNKLSPGCVDCSRATGLTVDVTKECNRNCYFCFYPGPNKQQTKLIDIIKNIHARRNYVLSFGISGGECLLNLDATVKIIELAKILLGSLCQARIYTNGDMLNRSNLKKLQAVGLDEIRISIKPDNKIFEKIALAKEYIPRVMVETPIFPDREEEFKKILLKLNKLKIFGINLLEFVFCCRNAHIYKKRGYKLMTDKVNDFSIAYPYDYPVYGSEAACFNLLEFAAKENFSIGVHYCSLKNKLYCNYKEILNRIKIGKKIKLEFIKSGKFNKEQFFLKWWVDQA